MMRLPAYFMLGLIFILGFASLWAEKAMSHELSQRAVISSNIATF